MTAGRTLVARAAAVGFTAIFTAVLAGAPIAAQSRAAGEATFDAKLLPVRADLALDFWHRTPQASGPRVSVVERVHPNDAVLLLVVLQNIGDAGGGQGGVTLRISTIDGTGATEVLAEDVPAWAGNLPPKDILVLSQAVPEFYFDDEDPMGTTTVVVEARDRASEAVVRAEARLELVPWSYGESPADADAYAAWSQTYYQAPAPGSAVRAYLEFAQIEQNEGKSWNFGTLGMYRTVFGKSPWLLDHLVSRFEDADDGQRTKIMLMLHLVGQGERIEQLPFGDAESRAKTRAAVEQVVLPDPYQPIAGAEQLDLLWGEFFASGRYAPVRQLVTALELARFEGEIEKFPKSAKTEADRERLLKGIVFGAARWSLDSNMKRHPLVLAYAAHIAENEQLGEDERQVLEELLEKHGSKR